MRPLRMLIAGTVAAVTVPDVAMAQGLLQSRARDGTTNIVFPSVIDFIYDGAFDVVPDDQQFRTYIVSVYKGMDDICDPGSGIGTAAGFYGFSYYRQLRDDPNGAVMGTLTKFLDGMVTMSKGDLIGGLSSISEGNPRFAAEGIEDGSALMNTFKCNTLEGRTLRVQFDRLMGARQTAPTQQNDGARYGSLMHPKWRGILGAEGASNSFDLPSVESERAALRRRANEQRLEKLAEERQTFERARSANDVSGLRAYQRQYGNSGTFAREARTALEALDRKEFQAAQSRGSLIVYRQYANTFPDGASIAQANTAIAGFDDAAFRQSNSANTINAYNSYLLEFPNGKNRRAAEEAIVALDKAAYERARRLSSIPGYEEYLQNYPRGRYSTQSRGSVDLTRSIANTRNAIRETGRRQSAEQSKALGFGVTSVAALAGGAFLGYRLYQEAVVYDSLNKELNADQDTENYNERKADLDAKVKPMVIYGVGSVAALVIGGKLYSRVKNHRQASATIASSKRELETRLQADEQRMQNLRTERISLAPFIDFRRGNSVGLMLTLQTP